MKTASPRPPDIQSAREREIERLLKLLEENPEEGLRYALPLGGGHAGRGVAAPSTRLSLRDLGFSLGGGGGGGPADVWEPRAEQQWKLQQKYREQANAAILEGNFERAAYIHAKLLGDWRAAASVLEQGGLWRKAAQVHEEKLHDLSNAARCLEKAGALEEAAERYAKVHQDEKAGDLWSKLGRQAEAEAAWRRAVSRARTALDKARLLFEKLGDHDAAFGVLEAAWPGSSEAEPCLRKQWEYLRRLGRDDERLVLVKRLGREELARLRPAARMLATLAHWRDDEGDGTLADALEDLSWTIAGETLAAAPARAEAREVLGLVPGLAEKDKTLAEDARRFLARGTEAPAPLPRAKGAMVLREKGVRGSFKTPATWDDAAVVDGQWICQGRKQAGGDMTYALFVRGVKEPGDARAFSIYPWAILPGAHIVHGIQWGPRGRHAVVSKAVFSAFAAGGWPKVGSGDGFLRPACLAEALAVALQPDSEILFALVPAASGVVEAQVWAQGRLVASHALALGEWPLDWRYPACARDGAFYFAVGPLLVRCRIKEGFDFDRDVVDFGEPIVGLAAAPSPFPHRLLVVAGPRAVLVEPEQALAMQDIYRDPRGNALVGAVFTKDGHAVPVGTQGSVFVRAGEAVEPAGRMEVGFPDGTRFAALAPLDDPAGFTYLTEDGQFGAIRPG